MTHLIFIVAAMIALMAPYPQPAHGGPGTIVAAPADVILPAGGG